MVQQEQEKWKKKGKKSPLTFEQTSVGKTGENYFKKVRENFNRHGQADGTIYVSLTKNNTRLTLTNPQGDVVTWTSCQNCGFFGGQKTTPRATISTAEEIGLRALDFERKKVNIVFRGKRRLRNAVFRGLARAKIAIQEITLRAPVPYNGCRLERKGRK